MFTKSEIRQLQSVIQSETRQIVEEVLGSKENRSIIREESQSVIEEALAPIKKDLKKLDTNMKKVHKDLKKEIKYVSYILDKQNMRTIKRVETIEDHLGFPPQAA
ncbi:MAG: hypothetical protein KBD46_02170 [Candidatus Levybacteria bacterium]|nr:hypothetical protein [Candidatus Levybacteria bacterium]